MKRSKGSIAHSGISSKNPKKLEGKSRSRKAGVRVRQDGGTHTRLKVTGNLLARGFKFKNDDTKLSVFGNPQMHPSSQGRRTPVSYAEVIAYNNKTTDIRSYNSLIFPLTYDELVLMKAGKQVAGEIEKLVHDTARATINRAIPSTIRITGR